MPSSSFYDSSAIHRPVVDEFRNLWKNRDLIRLLVGRDLTVRYKRSFLGLAWTLLNPLLTMGVMWIVFSRVFRFEVPGVPFSIYLLSGILVVTFFSQGVISAGNAMINNRHILSKIYVPGEVFSFSAVMAAATNFLISLVPLLLIQLIVGLFGSPSNLFQFLPWTIVLVPIPALALLAFATGIGLLVAAAAVYFYDVLDLVAVVLQLVGYLTPTFYPISIFAGTFLLRVVQANPLYSYLVIFRGFVYEGVFAPGWTFAMMFISAIGTLGLGVWVFARSWKRLAVLI